MSVEVQKARLLTTGQVAATERLENASGDRMVTADGHRPTAGGVESGVVLGDHLDRALVVVAFAQRHVTQATDPGHLPRVDAEMVVDPAADRRHIADGAGSEMLVTLLSLIHI